ncbi:hypothetical protein GDO81_021902 [Engystomops pustulosus]|uniref:Uncharacterized protein n=1 Tax=Engystomops pustulosus TaxID=76066 RepID=A0AAV6ZNX3_ENGPU|nr:hypothetical protein GDO81_021902 [Engystomops pustulosus]
MDLSSGLDLFQSTRRNRLPLTVFMSRASFTLKTLVKSVSGAGGGTFLERRFRMTGLRRDTWKKFRMRLLGGRHGL